MLLSCGSDSQDHWRQTHTITGSTETSLWLLQLLTLGVHAQRGLLYLVCVSVCVCLRLFSHYRQRCGLLAIATAQYNKRSKIKVAILLLSLYQDILSLCFVHLVSGPSASKF